MTLKGKRALMTGAIRGSEPRSPRRWPRKVPMWRSPTRSRRRLPRRWSARSRRWAVAPSRSRPTARMPPPSRHRSNGRFAELGGLDILVNNAGILRLSEVKDISLEDIDATLNVNVRAPIIASKAAIPHLGQGGRIINIGSFFADRVPGGAGLPVYALSKSALSAFTKGLARELGPRDITVNVVQPGSIDTDMNPAHGPFGETLRFLTVSPPSVGTVWSRTSLLPWRFLRARKLATSPGRR